MAPAATPAENAGTDGAVDTIRFRRRRRGDCSEAQRRSRAEAHKRLTHVISSCDRPGADLRCGWAEVPETPEFATNPPKLKSHSLAEVRCQWPPFATGSVSETETPQPISSAWLTRDPVGQTQARTCSQSQIATVGPKIPFIGECTLNGPARKQPSLLPAAGNCLAGGQVMAAPRGF